MKRILKEYGLIATLVVLSVAGYFLVTENKDIWLSYSLDTLGNRLASLVEDPAARDQILDSFNRFKEQVANEEVAPAQVEAMAANVLNLTAHGARLSRDEAEMVIRLATEPVEAALPVPSIDRPNPPDSPSAPRAPAPARRAEPSFKPTARLDDAEWKNLGKRLGSMFTLADSLNRTVYSFDNPGKAVRYTVGSKGLQVILDTSSTQLIQAKELEAMARSMNRENMVQWKRSGEAFENIQERQHADMRQRLQQYQVVLDSISGSAESQAQLVQLKQLSRLSSLGVHAGFDSSRVQVDVERILDRVMKDVERSIQSIEIRSSATGTGVKVGSGKDATSGNGTSASSSSKGDS